MNKNELIESVAAASGLNKVDAKKAVEGFVETVQSTLAKGDGITLVGFGTFSVTARAARTGRNPRTGEEIQIKASKNPTFKAGKGFKETVNK